MIFLKNSKSVALYHKRKEMKNKKWPLVCFLQSLFQKNEISN
jgi:hypothetical protein